MEEVVLVSGCRTPIGRLSGGFENTSASDLAAIVIREAVSRAGIKPEQVDQVIIGCVGQVMEDGYISRHASVKAGLPVEHLVFFYPKYFFETARKAGQYAIMVWNAYRLLRRVERDATKGAYSDLAITPPSLDELETLAMFNETSGGEAAVAD
jgi:acetyl-CoA acetyltransferase